MARCACGADIRWGVRDDTGEPVPLEYHSALGPGEGRFVITSVRPDGHHVVTPVSPASEAEAYTDHRIDCSHHGNGLRPYV